MAWSESLHFLLGTEEATINFPLEIWLRTISLSSFQKHQQLFCENDMSLKYLERKLTEQDLKSSSNKT